MGVDSQVADARAATVLATSPCFRGLADNWLERLAGAAEQKAVPAGAELPLEEGLASSPCLYLLLAGEVSASTPPDRDGASELLGHERPGDVFGSGSVTAEDEVPVYRAVGPVELCVWNRDALERLFEDAEELGEQLRTRLSSRGRRAELVDLVRRTLLFQRTSQSLIRWLVTSATLGRFEAESTICREGDEADAMFVIVSGEVAVFQHASGSGDPFRQLRSGDCFGEIALVERSARTASAVAVTDCEALIISTEAFDVLCRRSSSFRDGVRVIAERRLGFDEARGRQDPELVWLVNESACPTAALARLIAGSLEAIGERVAAPQSLRVGRGVGPGLEAGRRARASFVVCYCEQHEPALARRIADRAGSVVFVSESAAVPLPYESRLLDRIHHVVVPPADAASGQPVRWDAITLPLRRPELLGSRAKRLPDDAETALGRIARAITGRRVGVVLGGGAAWGYAHVALLRGLEGARIPVDMLFGVSMGSLVGAFYASGGLDGIERLVDINLELTAAALGAVATTALVDVFLTRHIAERRLEQLSLPFATVAVDAQTGREKVFRHGSIRTAVRASCSLPGVFGPSILRGRRYLDAAVRNNVPANHCLDAGADFVIACDVVPPPGAFGGGDRRGLRSLVMELSQLSRLTDGVRSLYWLTGDTGRAQARLANAVFMPNLAEFQPWDFARARAIIARTERQLDEWLPATTASYRALAHTGRRDG